MLITGRKLKRQLVGEQPVIGLMATDHAWPFLVEICQRSGMDYLILDREHGDFSAELTSHICQVARLAEFPVLIRSKSCEPDIVSSNIDLGPCGLILPCVETVAQLEQVREAAWMPPRGRRRPGGMGNYWLGDFQYETWKTEFEDHFLIIPQIESRLGVENVEAIAAHPLVTAVGLGPYDLSADLGCCWNPGAEEFQTTLRHIKTVTNAAGKKVWAGCDGPALRDQGYSFLWVGTASMVLTNALTRLVQEIRDPNDSAPSDTNPAPPA